MSDQKNWQSSLFPIFLEYLFQPNSSRDPLTIISPHPKLLQLRMATLEFWDRNEIYSAATVACCEGTVEVPALHFVYTTVKGTNNPTCDESPPTKYSKYIASTSTRAFDKSWDFSASVLSSLTHIRLLQWGVRQWWDKAEGNESLQIFWDGDNDIRVNKSLWWGKKNRGDRGRRQDEVSNEENDPWMVWGDAWTRYISNWLEKIN